jgi:hypothetical protein
VTGGAVTVGQRLWVIIVRWEFEAAFVTTLYIYIASSLA